jgi:hypothetical protein
MRGQCGLHLGPLSASGLGCAKTPESNLRAEILARFRQFESQKCLRPLWEKTIEKTILCTRGSGSFLRSQGHWVEPDSSPETFRPSGGRTGSLGEAGYRVGFLEQWSHTAQSASPPRPDLADLDRKVRFGATKERNGTASTHPRAGRSSTLDLQGQNPSLDKLLQSSSIRRAACPLALAYRERADGRHPAPRPNPPDDRCRHVAQCHRASGRRCARDP